MFWYWWVSIAVAVGLTIYVSLSLKTLYDSLRTELYSDEDSTTLMLLMVLALAVLVVLLSVGWPMLLIIVPMYTMAYRGRSQSSHEKK